LVSTRPGGQGLVTEKSKKMSAVTTVYTLPSCVQCDSTKKFLDLNEVEYNVVDMSQDETALELVKALGYQAAPVVIAGDDHWSGFRPDMIAKLAAA